MAGSRENSVLPGIFKRKYLIQLIATAGICFFIPAAIYFGIVFSRSYNEVLAAREDYFQEITRIFGAAFRRQVAHSYSVAIQISVDSRDSRSPSFALQSSRFQLSPYYYLECMRALAEYAKESYPEAGVYFPSLDCLFTKTAKYTADSYIMGGLGIREDGVAKKIKDFLGSSGESILFCSTFPDMYDRGILLIGVPVTLGMLKEDALIFFCIDSGAFDFSVFYSEGEAVQFCVFGGSGTELVYSAGNFFPREITASLAQAGFPPASLAADTRYRFFAAEDRFFGNRYVSIIPLDRITSRIYAFIRPMQKIAAVACIVIILLLCFMVYINYKPVGNFADEISERNQLILDLLLGSLLYGLPIPRKEAEELGLQHTGRFCVITVFRMQFRTEDRKALTAGLYERFSITSYMTDILYRNHTVIICLLPPTHTLSAGEIGSLEQYFSALVQAPAFFKIGKAANSLGEIKDSYQTCLEWQRDREVKEFSPSKEKTAKQRKAAGFEETTECPDETGGGAEQFRNRVLRYVREQFNNPQLSQISVADHFGISIYSLSRLFNNDIGIGFSEFIIARRMDCAMDLLLSTDKDIADIAAAVGITNANYFSRLFKSYSGVTPTRYRTERNRVKS